MSSIIIWAVSAFIVTMTGSALLLLRREWSQSNVWRILAFASGVLLGVSFIHILPQANLQSPHVSGLGVLLAFLMIFLVEQFTMMHSCSEYVEKCDIHVVGWTAFGALTLHALLDGMAIAVAFKNDAGFGQIVSTAILIHKFTDGLTLTGLLVASHYSNAKCFQIVSCLALATPLGALLFFPLSHWISDSVTGGLLGFVAGSFFYVGAADILPRIHKIKDAYCLGTFALGLLIGGLHW